MLEGILGDLVTGGFLGGVTGLIGTIWSSHNKRKLYELEMQDKARQRDHDLNMVRDHLLPDCYIRDLVVWRPHGG